MRHITIVLMALILLCGSAVQAQFSWARSGLAAGDEQATGVSTDPQGNSYVVGRFASPSVTVTTSSGPTTLTNFGAGDVFLAKYDPTGALVWIQNFGGTGNDYPWRVSACGNGLIAVVGNYYSPSITFGTNPPLVNSGSGIDGFLAVFDQNGVAQWSRNIAGSSSDEFRDVSMSASGIIVAGRMSSPTLTLGAFNLTNNGTSGSDILVARYDMVGNVVWASNYGGSGSENAIGLAVNGNRIYVTGNYTSSPLVIGAFSTGTTLGGADMFVTAIDANNPANIFWLNWGGGNSQDNFMDCATDQAGGVYIHGTSQSTTFAINGATVAGFPIQFNASAPASDVYTFKFSESTGTAQWVRQGTGSGYEFASCVEADGCGNVYVGGRYALAGVNFNGNVLSGTTNYGNIYMIGYDANGNVTNVTNPTVTGNGGAANDIAIDYLNEPIVVGRFSPSVTFSGTPTLNTSGGNLSDYFVAKGNFGIGADWQQTSYNSLGDADGKDVIVDCEGNVYMTGVFKGQTTLGYGASAFTLNGAGMFTAKYSDCGQLMWAMATQNGQASPRGIALDEGNGWVYVCGNLASTSNEVVGSGQGAGITGCGNTQTISGSSYLARFDMSDGCLQLVNTYGGDYKANSVATDDVGNVFLGSEFTLGGVKRVAATKFAPTFGAPTWFQMSNGPVGSNCFVADIAVGKELSGNQNVYLTGNFFRQFTVGPFTEANPPVYDAFVYKLSDLGSTFTVDWLQKGGADIYSTGASITVDPQGNAYVTGSFNEVMNPAFGSGIVMGNSQGMGFVARLDAGSGGIATWVNPIIAAAGVIGTGITGDESGLYLTGYWHGGPALGPITFAPSQGIPPIPFNGNATAPSMKNVYVAHYTYNNTAVGTWGAITEGPDLHRSRGIAVSNSGFAYTTGDYRRDMNLAPYLPAPQGQIISTVGVRDAFLLRSEKPTGDFLKVNPGLIPSIETQEGPEVFPNPNRGTFEVRFPEGENARLEIYDLQGKLQLRKRTIDGNAKFHMTQFAKGVYLLRWVDETGEMGNKRIVIQ